MPQTVSIDSEYMPELDTAEERKVKLILGPVILPDKLFPEGLSKVQEMAFGVHVPTGEFITQPKLPEIFIPAVGQSMVGIEVKAWPQDRFTAPLFPGLSVKEAVVEGQVHC